MTPASIAALVRRTTRTDTNSYTNANLLIDLNIFKNEMAGRIQQARPDIWNMPALADLEAGQREYSFPSDMINSMVSLEIMFDASGDPDTDYVVATAEKRVPDFPISEDDIAGTYDNTNPRYFIRRNGIYILSGTILAVTDGLKLVYDLFPADVTDITSTTDLSTAPSTTSHGFPREFHELLARRISIHFKDLKGMKLSDKEKDYDIDLERKLSEFSNYNQSLAEIAEIPSSESLSNHGYDL